VPTLPQEVSNARFSLLLLLSFFAVLFVNAGMLRAQDDEDSETEDLFMNQGGALTGSAGYFRLSSAEVLRPAHMNIGFYAERGSGSITPVGLPVFLGYGIAKLSEGFMTLYSDYNPRLDVLEHTVAFGIKGLLFSLQKKYVAIEFNGESLNFDDESEESPRYLRFTGKGLFTAILPHDISATLALGYRWMSNDEVAGESHLMFGVGALVPVSKNGLVLADLEGRMYQDSDLEIDGRLGVKWFFLDHIQAMAGYHVRMASTREFHGAFVGISFSTELLRTERNPEEDESFPELPTLEALDGVDNNPKKTEEDTKTEEEEKAEDDKKIEDDEK
jgi:hypothetical protein